MSAELKYVLLYVRDLKAAKKFYEDIIGLTPLSTKSASDVVIFSMGSAKLVLHLDKEVPSELLASRGAGIILEFDTKSTDEAFASFVERKIEIVREPRDMPFGLRQLYVRDPDGYLLCLSEAVKPRMGSS